MSGNPPRPPHRWVAALAIVAALALGFACFLAWRQWRAGPAGLPLLPVPAKEPEITLTPAEAADAEAQLRGMTLEMLTGGFEIEKITRVGKDYVIHCKTKDSVMECHLRRIPDKDRKK